jgi:hypothetical protein
MSTKLIFLDLLENPQITIEEALELLSAMRQNKSREPVPQEQQSILIKLLSGRNKNV